MELLHEVVNKQQQHILFKKLKDISEEYISKNSENACLVVARIMTDILNDIENPEDNLSTLMRGDIEFPFDYY